MFKGPFFSLGLLFSSLFFSGLLFSAAAAAAPLSPQGFVLQGTILTPSGLPEEGSSVAFTIQIKTTDANNCLLYSQTQTLNMNNSGGAFSLTIDSVARPGLGFEYSSSLAQVFSNAPVAMSPLSCDTAATSYTPASGDSRKVVITFDDGSGPQTLTQTLAVQAVPYALYADTLEGKSANDFIKVNNSSGKVLTQTNLESVFASTANVAELLALINGSSTSFAGSASPTFTGAVTASGGIQGSTASGGDLTIDSTSHGTKGEIILAPNGGNVGIGTLTPTAKLEVVGSGLFSSSVSASNFSLPNPNLTYGSSMSIDANNNTAWYGKLSGSDYFFIGGVGASEVATLVIGTGDNANEDIAFHTGLASGNPTGTERLRIQASTGNIGIGTSGPSATLHVVQPAGTGNRPNVMTITGATSSTAGGSGGGIALASGAGNGSGGGGSLSLASGAGNGGGAASLTLAGGNFSGAAVTLNAGNGGGGGGGPVNITAGGGIGAGVGTGGNINLTGGTGTNGYDGGHTVLNGGVNGGGAGVDGNVILANVRGKVGIGTSSPQTTLQVAGVISPATNNTYTLGNATYRFTEVFATNGVINTSDRREKKDIYDTDLGLDFINKLRPVSYRWNTGVDSDVHYGLIAQEAEQVLAEVGKTAKTSIVNHDETTDRYGVRYSELIAPLIKAVQQLYSQILGFDREIASVKAQAEVEKAAKDQEIAELKARLEKIEKMLDAK